MSKTIAYDYCFNCADIPYNDEIIDGTSVMISFVAYNALFKEINLSDAMRTNIQYNAGKKCLMRFTVTTDFCHCIANP